MCTIFLATDPHPDWSLLLLGNRDEFHARPSQDCGWWPDTPGLLAGRDLQRGGIWLGVTRRGRWCATTNVRRPSAHEPPANAPSRGKLGLEFLARSQRLHDWLDRLAESAGSFPGYNLLLGEGASGYWVSNRLPLVSAAGQSICRRLDPGIHGLSNGTLNEDWPKVREGRLRLKQLLLQQARPEEDALLDLLLDQRTWPDAQLPDTGVGPELERRLSALFIRGREYGTRASTLLIREHSGRWILRERRWAPEGVPAGDSRFEFMEESQETRT
ncbi:MAG: NRDE family protein [Candidatus Delongbacteria bacterium]|nr:NRDE family protein [Candidatus Delongbacteria bacterium]